MSEQQTPTARLAALAERLQKIGWALFPMFDGKSTHAYQHHSGRLSDDIHISESKIVVRAELTPAVWEALDIIRAWQSGPASDRDRTEITEAMVEAGAKAIWDHAFPGKEWDYGLRSAYREDAIRAIEAALAAGTESPR